MEVQNTQTQITREERRNNARYMSNRYLVHSDSNITAYYCEFINPNIFDTEPIHIEQIIADTNKLYCDSV